MIFKISKFGFFSVVFVVLMTMVTQTWALDGEQGDLVAGDSVSAVVSSGDADARVSETEASAEPSGDTISLDFKDADINTVLRILSMKSGMNIVSGPEVKGVVTVRLDNVPWDKALNVILRTYDYVYERDGNIIRVTSREKMGQEPVETKTFILNYSKAAEIQSAVQDILTERGRIKVAERTNMVVVTDIPTNLYRIGEVIENLDKVTPQAYVDSKIINTDSSYVENMGIQWTPSASITGATRPTTFPFSQTGQSSLPGSLQQFFPVVSVDQTAMPPALPEKPLRILRIPEIFHIRPRKSSMKPSRMEHWIFLSLRQLWNF
ncbi:MAG TPA: secretin and TonB N-terminal domain-containing protein [Candidatus Omnitrophota bacterium]|nr:secretin and TonB N-terminal domain-containing protein [Candidatus Omnitrophota bacterium]